MLFSRYPESAAGFVGGAPRVNTVIHRIFRIAVKVHVGVDQTRQASKFGQVMDNCLIREGWGGTRVVDVDNASTSDMDRLIQPWVYQTTRRSDCHSGR